MNYQKMSQLDLDQRAHCVITQIGVRGEAPANLGAKCVVTEQGLHSGTVGGGKIEAYAINKALELLKKTKGPVLTREVLNLQRDIKMTCGGEVEFLYEVIRYKHMEVVIFGAGHVAQALSKSLSQIDCRAHFIDPRSEWLEGIEFGEKHLAPSPKELVSQFNDQTFFISMTQGHSTDLPIVEEIAKCFPNPRFIGVIGSKQKANTLKRELSQLGVAKDFLDQIHCPIGLPLGSNHTGEIAISIVAQLIQKRDESS